MSYHATRRIFLKDSGLAAAAAMLGSAGCSKAPSTVAKIVRKESVIDFFVSWAGGLLGQLVNDDILRFLRLDRPESRMGLRVADDLAKGGFVDLGHGGVRRIGRTFCFGALDKVGFEGCVAFMSVLGNSEISVAMIEGPAVVTLSRLTDEILAGQTPLAKQVARHPAGLARLLVPVDRSAQSRVVAFAEDGVTKYDAPAAHVTIDHTNRGDEIQSRVTVQPTVGDRTLIRTSYRVDLSSIGL